MKQTMKILLHSSKTMKPESTVVHKTTLPQFATQAAYLNSLLGAMDIAQLAELMTISPGMANAVKQLSHTWQSSDAATPAALTFRGDIYSGLAAGNWNKDDAAFAQSNLIILSGLYGLLRPYDAIKPYRLEMGYKLILPNGLRLDKFWQAELAGQLPTDEPYINLTAAEYFKAIKTQLYAPNVITPKFLTMNESKNEPVFVTVHAKIARGSFASWLIRHKIDDPDAIIGYDQLGYAYDKNRSTPLEPVFVCREFGGLGLSVRLK